MPSKVFPKYVEWEDLWSGPISQRVEYYKLYVSAVSEINFPSLYGVLFQMDEL